MDIRIPFLNAFKLRITGNITSGTHTETADMNVVRNLIVNFVRRGRIFQAHGIDVQGRIVILNLGTLPSGTYGVELVGYYNGEPWRFFRKDVFEIVRQNSDATPAGSGDVPTYDVTFELNFGGESVSPEYVDAAIAAHDADGQAHADIREALQTLETELRQEIAEAGEVNDVQIDGQSILDPETKVANIDSSQFGKVDDVKVNGVSVLDAETKEASIDITASVVENDTPGNPTANATMQDGNINIEFEHVKGERGNGIASVTEELSDQDGGINTHTIHYTDPNIPDDIFHTRNGRQGRPGADFQPIEDVSGLHIAHDLGYDEAKVMSQEGVTNAVEPLKRVINGEDTDFTYISSGAAAGKMMHPNSPSISSNLVTPASGTGQISEAKFIKQGETVRVTTYCDTARQFAAIAKFSSPTATGGTKLGGMGIIASDPPVLNTREWTADEDCYVRVSGIVEGMTAAIIPASRVAKKSELDSAVDALTESINAVEEGLQEEVDGIDERLTVVEGKIAGKMDIPCDNVGVLHPNTAQISFPNAGHTARYNFRYSNIMTLHQGDVVYVKTYRKDNLTSTNIASYPNTDVSSSGTKHASTRGDDPQNAFIEYSYTVESETELIRVCGWVGGYDGEPERELITTVTPKGAIATLEDLQEVQTQVEDVQAQVEEIANGSSTLPDYWKEHIQAKLDEVATEQGGDSFIFITDVHYSQNFGMSTDVIANIVKDYPFAKVIVGGDICSTGFDMKNDSAGAYTNYDQMMTREIKAFEQLFDKAGKYARVYTARGNHDYSEHNQVSKTKHWASEAVKHMRGLIDGIGVYDNAANSPDSLYYYFDNREAKIRYIIVDCVDGSDIGSLVISNTQMQWVAATLNDLEEEWKAVIVGHCPITTYFAVSYETGRDKFPKFREMLLAYNKRLSPTIDGISYDFSEAVGKIILYIHGHTHVDNQAFHDGIPCVATMCDKYNHHAWSPFAEGTDLAVSPKTKVTAKEQAFDAVTIDADKLVVSCRRIGLGHDRHFHVGEIEVQAGSTVPLEASIITPSLWKACDEDVMNNNAATDAKGSGDYDMPVKNVFATIDSNGVVTANAQGDVLVFAEDADHNREFFHIKVIG